MCLVHGGGTGTSTRISNACFKVLGALLHKSSQFTGHVAWPGGDSPTHLRGEGSESQRKKETCPHVGGGTPTWLCSQPLSSLGKLPHDPAAWVPLCPPHPRSFRVGSESVPPRGVVPSHNRAWSSGARVSCKPCVRCFSDLFEE